MRNRAEKLAPIAALALYLLLLLMVLALAGAGGILYERLADARIRNDALRASLSYVAARIRNADSENAVQIVAGPQGDALELAAPEDRGYVTHIYAYDGNLYEEYILSGEAFDPDNGQIVAQTETFAVRREGEEWIITTDVGEIRVTPTTQQEASE